MRGGELFVVFVLRSKALLTWVALLGIMRAKRWIAGGG